MIVVDNEKIIIQDLDSTNGIYLNGKKTAEAVVLELDQVKLGEFSLTVFLNKIENEIVSLSSNLEIKAGSGTEIMKSASDISKSPDIDKVKDEEDEIENFYWESLQAFLAPVWGYLSDDTVTEVLINGPKEVFIEKQGRLIKTDSFFTEDQLHAAVLNISQYVGRRISEDEPILDARLPDGSRVAIVLPPCSRKGVSVSIRKFSREKLTLDKLLDFGSLSEEMLIFIKACVLLRKNIIISGGTSSGKTSLLNVISSLIPADERILTIEDSAELQLMQEHVLPMETKPADKKGRGLVTIRELVKASLRMRPDRIVVGEIRGGEAIDLLQAMNTGHSGSMATLHASSPLQALTRLETLALFSGLDLPMRALREQVSSAIDIVVQAARLPDHSRKVTNIAVVNALGEDGSYQVHDVFRFKYQGGRGAQAKGTHIMTGYVPDLVEECEIAGLTEVVSMFVK